VGLWSKPGIILRNLMLNEMIGCFTLYIKQIKFRGNRETGGSKKLLKQLAGASEFS
jgi:hypothetical protein